MMIAERGVSYYGVMYPDRAALDFEEMIEHGCNAVLFGISEFDWWFWRKNVKKLIKVAKDHGLNAYVDLWGWGKTLSGEPPSIFLQQDINHRQVAVSGKLYDAICINYQEFRDLLKRSIREIAGECELDGFFWDEPHYANWFSTDWACRCQICQALYKQEYGEEMPTSLDPKVVEFRERKAVEFLAELSRTVKEADPKIDVTVCLLPIQSPLIGITDWEKVATIREIDVFATDPYWFFAQLDRDKGLEFFRSTSQKAVQIARKYGKRVQVWVQAFLVPEGRENEIEGAVDIAEKLGVDSFFAWTYRGGRGSILECDEHVKVWDVLGKAYKKVAEG